MNKGNDEEDQRHTQRIFFRRLRSSMYDHRLPSLVVIGVVVVRYSAPGFSQQTGAGDWKAVEQALGKTGSLQPGDVYKVSFPRSDLKVMIAGLQLKPALALGSWVAFKKTGDMTAVMGDLVLTEDEVTPVMTKLQEGGVEQTALHNHVLHES